MEKKCFSSVPRLENRKIQNLLGIETRNGQIACGEKRTFMTMKHILNGHHPVLTYNDE